MAIINLRIHEGLTVKIVRGVTFIIHGQVPYIDFQVHNSHKIKIANTNTAFTLAQLNLLYLNQINFQPIKCTRFVGLCDQKGPFHNLV